MSSQDSLVRIAESLRETLRSRGFKVSTPSPAGACVELGVDSGKGVFFVYLYPGRFSEAIVAKLTPTMCGCDRAIVCPYGLYALAEPEAIGEAILSKVDRILVIARAVEEEGINL